MKHLLVYTLAFFFLSSYSQEFKVIHSRTKEPIDNVTGILYQGESPTKVLRSDFQGEINFKIEKNKTWDSVIFYRLGFKKVTLTKSENQKVVEMQSISNVIEEVIITGLIVPSNKYQSPFKHKFYTAEEIKNKNAVTLADFLLSENNFTITQDPIFGSKVTINGMGGADLKLMIDGIPVAGRLNGNIDYSQIMLADKERIEVVDGPLSTIYGTNATGGVINLITKTGTNSESSLSGNIYAESVGVLNANAYYFSSQKGHRVSLGVHRNVFLGWDPNADSLRNVVKPIWRHQSWSPKEQFIVNTSYYAPISKRLNMHFKINGFWETIVNKLDPSSSQQINVVDEYYNTRKFNIGGNSNAVLSKAIEWQNYTNFNYFGRLTEYFTQNLIEGSITPLNSLNEEILNFFGRSQFKHEFPTDKVKLLYGTDFNMDVGNSQKLDSGWKSVRDLSFFIMSSISLGKKVFMQPGLRYSFNNVTTVPMSATFNVRYDISSHLSSRFSYSRGYRIPEIKELYFKFVDINHNIIGNPNLQTELNDNFQLGIDLKQPKDKVKTSLISYATSLNTTFFHKQNAIDIVNINPATNEFQYLNLGDYYGLIFNIDNRVKYKDFMLVFGTSLNGFSRRFNGVQEQMDKYMFNWTVNANMTYNVKKYDVKLTAVNKFYSLNNFVVYNLASNKVEQSQFPAYMYTDINASKTIFNKKLNVTLGVKNIFDIQNLRVLGYSGNVHNFSNSNEVNNLWGRSLFTSLTLNLDDL